MSSKPVRGLGRGLGVLLGEQDTNSQQPTRKPIGYVNKEIVGSKVPQDTSDILRIPIGLIEPNPFQPRVTFSEEALAELAESIRTFGLIQPITVRPMAGGKYQIISGERRYRASQAAGMDMIPAYIINTSDQGMLEMAIVENIQRENLDPIEVAMSYRRLIEECHLTQEEMAGRVGKKRVSVTNYLRLLKLPAKVQHDIKVGLLSVGHAKVILGVEDEALQEQLCDLAVKGDLSVRALEDKVRKLSAEKSRRNPSGEQPLPEEYTRILERVGKYFDNNISLKRSASGKGTLTLKFDSDAQVLGFLETLGKAGI